MWSSSCFIQPWGSFWAAAQQEGEGNLLTSSTAAEQGVLRNTPLQELLSSRQCCSPAVMLLDRGVEGQGSLQKVEEEKFSSEKREQWEMWWLVKLRQKAWCSKALGFARCLLWRGNRRMWRGMAALWHLICRQMCTQRQLTAGTALQACSGTQYLHVPSPAMLMCSFFGLSTGSALGVCPAFSAWQVAEVL